MSRHTSVARVGLVIGGVMAALGIYIAGRLVLLQAPPLSGNRWLDIAFAIFFVARGALQYRRWRQTQESSAAPGE